ncbi:hypothetical protein GOP47_0008516 [Adiantum capillus-veneris]|uniref:Uncharacterized protein n=1 Tax=Adiantum capillus-veneris TaxID=13818 RepID=A0A9D4ZKH9_ADICA|nr:hypothetical protein GOP47_0008516 [Adiantum capillus-veneris]
MGKDARATMYPGRGRNYCKVSKRIEGRTSTLRHDNPALLTRCVSAHSWKAPGSCIVPNTTAVDSEDSITDLDSGQAERL